MHSNFCFKYLPMSFFVEASVADRTSSDTNSTIQQRPTPLIGKLDPPMSMEQLSIDLLNSGVAICPGEPFQSFEI